MKKILPTIVRIAVAILFLISALSKMFNNKSLLDKLNPAVWPFEKQLVDLGLCDWCMSHYLARGIIGLEIAIAFALLFNHWIKRLIIPLTILLLVAFCIHLGIQGKEFGFTNGNCGCFGQLLPMTPLEAILKNIFTIALLVYLWFSLTENVKGKNNLIYPIAIFLASQLLMFVAYPFAPCGKENKITDANNTTPIADSSTNLMDSVIADVQTNTVAISGNNIVDTNKTNSNTVGITNTITAKKDSTKTKINTTTTKALPSIVAATKTAVSKTNAIKPPVNTTIPSANNGPAKVVSKFAAYKNFKGTTINTDDGKKIICLFAPGCEHCQATAKELCAMKNADKNFPEVGIIFMDEEVEKIPDFFKVSRCAFPYQVLDIVSFWGMFGQGSTPGVFALHNGNILKTWEGINANEFKSAELKKVLE